MLSYSISLPFPNPSLSQPPEEDFETFLGSPPGMECDLLFPFSVTLASELFSSKVSFAGPPAPSP